MNSKEQTRLFALLCGFLFGVLPTFVHAAIAPAVSIPPASFNAICGATGLCGGSFATGILSIQSFLGDIIIPATKTIFVGVSLLYVSRYALTMIMFGGEESVQNEQRKAFADAARGMALVGLGAFIVNTFSPTATGAALVNPGPFIAGIDLIIDFITLITGAFLIFIISFAGFRIIVLQGEESEIEKQKKNFFNGLMGVVLLLTARVIVAALLPSGSPDDLVVEGAGIIRFLLELIAGLAVVSLIASGVLYIIALHNDSLQQRAKRILLSTIIILIIVIFSHLIVSTFIPPTLPPTTI